MPVSGGHRQPPVQKLVATIILPKAKCKSIPVSGTKEKGTLSGNITNLVTLGLYPPLFFILRCRQVFAAYGGDGDWDGGGNSSLPDHPLHPQIPVSVPWEFFPWVPSALSAL